MKDGMDHAIASAMVFCGGMVVAGIALAGCNLLTSRGAKTVENVVINIADAACVAEAETLDERLLADACHLAADVVRRLVAAKKAGIERAVAGERAGAAKREAATNDAGPPVRRGVDAGAAW